MALALLVTLLLSILALTVLTLLAVLALSLCELLLQSFDLGARIFDGSDLPLLLALPGGCLPVAVAELPLRIPHRLTQLIERLGERRLHGQPGLHVGLRAALDALQT